MWTDKMLRPGGPRFLVVQSKEIDWDLSQQKCARCTPFEGFFFFLIEKGKGKGEWQSNSADRCLQLSSTTPCFLSLLLLLILALTWSWLGCHQLQTHWGLGSFRKQNEQVSCVYMPQHEVVYGCNHSWVLKWYLQGATCLKSWTLKQASAELIRSSATGLLHESK